MLIKNFCANIGRAAATAASIALLAISCGQSFNPDSIRDARPEEIVRVEPPCWWTGMKMPLQLLVQGPDISGWNVRIEGAAGVQAVSIRKADSPNYLFVDVVIGSNAVPGTAWLVFDNGSDSFKFPYLLRGRDEGSASRGSFTTEDMIYLVMPDRFASGTADNDSSWPGGVYDDGSAKPWNVPSVCITEKL